MLGNLAKVQPQSRIGRSLGGGPYGRIQPLGAALRPSYWVAGNAPSDKVDAATACAGTPISSQSTFDQRR